MKHIVLTGASRGIGYQLSRRFAQNDHKVIAIARTSTSLETLANEEENVLALPADLTTEAGLTKVEHELQNIGQIDILINNAAMLVNSPFMETSLAMWKQQFDVNLFSIVELIQRCKPFMKSGSHIVNIGSMGGVQSSKKFTGLSAYSASKGALSILTECLALEFAEDEIAVNCLALGAVSTEMQKSAFPDFDAPVSAEAMSKFISDFALNGHTFMNGKILPISFSDPE